MTLTTDKEISAQWKNTPLDNDVGKIVQSLSGPETPVVKSAQCTFDSDDRPSENYP